ncbi:MAG: DUF4244 domain-containing protein [Actinobacteria bacterium]|nr:DUF4244 domain-containing protein [Actinomycetota bacterium]
MLATRLLVHVHVTALMISSRAEHRLERLRDERGQATAEYALVLLGAAGLALLVALWARKTNMIGKLLDSVFDNLLKMIG